MNIKIPIIALGTAVLLTGAATADTLRGEVYQVTDGDVYIEMADHTVARMPVETAQFYHRGNRTPYTMLKRGQEVMVRYRPIYGFQEHYHTEELDHLNMDVDTAIYDVEPIHEYLEYDGKIYRRVD